MLNTRFPRFVGDIGNPQSFRCEVFYRVVTSASTGAIVTADGIEASVAEELLAAGAELANKKVDLLLTSCGFLGELQQQLQQRVDVPVLSSSLVLLPLLRSLYAGSAKIGVMTIDSRLLGPQHLGQAATDPALTILGMQDCPLFFDMIKKDLEQADYHALQTEVCSAAEAWVQATGVRAIVLECTNLAPYKTALRQLLNLPVFDLMDAAHWVLGSKLPDPARSGVN